MIARKLILPMLAALMLGACAQVPPTLLKEAAPMTMSAGTYRPHTLDEYPELTPDEIGRRMLKLIDSLKSFDELSLERVREVTRLPLYDIPETTSHGFGMHLPASGWRYVFAYYNNPKSPDLKNISYNFINKNEAADMAPVCTMDYDAYVTALKGMGFQEREDMAQYETYPTLPPRLNERTGLLETPPPKFRRLPVYFFTRKSVVVQITRWREADAPDEKLRHACVQSIAVR
ncbi:hypothetical protein [Variovorax paradoxus]|uniref:hypothetical protein n=1 Tax=Variovorax paradoxus TaxID=34073 RepID=UPI0027850A69|nr:hypothetical protein [Variovorax paradoxus]MDP9929253.1 hypothetical protein [Variovorax paradoxus]